MNSRVFFSYSKWFVTEFRTSLYLPRNGSERNSECFSFPLNRWNSDGMNQNFRLFSVPENNFFSEDGNPNLDVRVGVQESKKIRQ